MVQYYIKTTPYSKLLQSIATYIELNPVRAGLGRLSEKVARAEAEEAIDEDSIRSSDSLRQLLVKTSQAQQVKQTNYLQIKDDC